MNLHTLIFAFAQSGIASLAAPSSSAPPMQPNYCNVEFCLSNRPTVPTGDMYAILPQVAEIKGLGGGAETAISYKGVGRILISIHPIAHCSARVTRMISEAGLLLRYRVQILNNYLQYLGKFCKEILVRLEPDERVDAGRLNKLLPSVWLLSQKNLYVVNGKFVSMPYEVFLNLPMME